jgi:threonine dehydratase
VMSGSDPKLAGSVTKERTLPVSPDDVLRASTAIGQRLHRTPILSSVTLGQEFGGRAVLKAELFQRTGSFKPRGMLTKLASLSAGERGRGVVTISAGNAAAALAYCAALEEVDCLVVTWRGASAPKVEAARAYGATVDQAAADPTEAFARLGELRKESGRTFVHPFDDPVVIAGHGTLGLELVEDCAGVEAIVVPVGGGGLLSGIAVAVKGARPDVRVVGVEPEQSAALSAALQAGKPVPVVPASLADGLNAPFAGDRCLALARALVDEVVTVSEDDIRNGFRFLYGRAKLAAEPAGAVGVAAALAGKLPGLNGMTAVFVVSGGNIAARTASGILGSREG